MISQSQECSLWCSFPRCPEGGSAGCNKLIPDERAKLGTSIEGIFAELDLTVAVQQLEIKVAIPANDDEGRLLALLSHDPVHVDDLVRQTAMAAPTVASTLMMLELKGSVRQIGSMSYVLAR